MKTKFLRTIDDVNGLPLIGSVVTQVRVSSARVDLVMETTNDGVAIVSLESSVSLHGRGSDRTLEAGAELGVHLVSLLDLRVVRLSSRSLNMVIEFEGGSTLTANIDRSQYESYSVTLNDHVWVAL
ncbi:MAG: hypothetical protein ACRCYU_24175, partial [Nocardioides sp.]